MKFPQIREFRPFSTEPQKLMQELAKYLSTDLVRTFKDLMVASSNLSFDDNFDAFVETITIPASTEVSIRNRLPSGLIPTSRLILRGGVGAENIVDGNEEWNQNSVSLRNQGVTPVEVKVVFLR